MIMETIKVYMAENVISFSQTNKIRILYSNEFLQDT